MEEKKGLSKSNTRVVIKDRFIFNSWFATKSSAEATKDVGDYIICIVKINKKGLFKDTI